MRFIDFGKSGEQLEEEQHSTHDNYHNMQSTVEQLKNSIENEIDPVKKTSKKDLLECEMLAFVNMDKILCYRTTLMYRWNWIHKNFEPIINSLLCLQEYNLWTPEFKHFLSTGEGLGKLSTQPLRSFIYRCRNHHAKINRQAALNDLEFEREEYEVIKKLEIKECDENLSKDECEMCIILHDQFLKLEKKEQDIEEAYQLASEMDHREAFGWAPVDIGLSQHFCTCNDCSSLENLKYTPPKIIKKRMLILSDSSDDDYYPNGTKRINTQELLNRLEYEQLFLGPPEV